jgi:hypothetical protein
LAENLFLLLPNRSWAAQSAEEDIGEVVVREEVFGGGFS